MSEWFDSPVADCFITWANILEAAERGGPRKSGGGGAEEGRAGPRSARPAAKNA
ncbi:MAG: hypothetical protein TU35_008615 [Thermoproteus sp. AZ2]|uniref:Uncharacterized protein n=1 Tax=Thermoproteus sp. AZ2 TaxID=1609232 RepID=A0ACC6V2W6_9CREN